MSHENIVATALYIAARDEGIQGGKLCFKRALEEWEGARSSEVYQYPFQYVYDFVERGMLPLGELETPDNRMLVFPNSHVHKVMRMINTGDRLAKRRIVVFFLVNPLVRIVSTKEVPDQRSTMSLERAKEHRLELMKERRLHKQDWNVREVGLCEH
uniref:DUF4246 domain-containing protein n=1 Tax=Pinguiococcus pyrenoidosus TaxID=172671 RepID=A0A7R9U5A3_9STRA